MKFANLVDRLQGARTSAWDIHKAARRAAARGEDVIVLSVGDPDLPTPAPIVDRAISALRDGDTHYTGGVGRDNLREAIAAEHQADTGRQVTKSNVFVCAGVQNGLFASSLCVCGPGDEAIVPEPMYLTYEAAIRASGATLVPVAVDAANGFHLDCKALKFALSARTRAIFFATPCNPTGAVMSREQLELIAALARERDLWVVADEVYADLTFERDHTSIASLEGMASRTMTLGSFSKSYAMTGWRLGWVIAPEPAIGHLGRLALCMSYGLPGFIQQAGVAALEQRQSVIAQMRELYRRRRDAVFQRLHAVPNVKCLLPEAGMFMMIDIRETGLSTYDFTWKLFREKGVSLLDASLFGPTANGFVRLGLVVDEQRLNEACYRIEQFVREQY
ncbi:pyridoxal phosphate-dependent aminotransferase [Paraburkholderia sp. BR13439]|uniref:pyridoxal phosphate-dependent aminotransferase n=1 Tax=unclassified Paraburkholderia TaxID=2615204 RepID=UPI0034CD128C